MNKENIKKSIVFSTALVGHFYSTFLHDHPEFPTYNYTETNERWEKLERLVSSGKWIVPIEEKHGDDAYYTILQEKIVMPTKEQYANIRDFLFALLHEMAHSFLIQKQEQNSDATGSFGAYKRVETHAELTALLVCMWLGGYEYHHKEDSLAYLGKSAYGQKNKIERYEIMDRAQECAIAICEAIDHA